MVIPALAATDTPDATPMDVPTKLATDMTPPVTTETVAALLLMVVEAIPALATVVFVVPSAQWFSSPSGPCWQEPCYPIRVGRRRSSGADFDTLRVTSAHGRH
jgi:hypothetical protein